MEISAPSLHDRRPQNVLLFCAILYRIGDSPQEAIHQLSRYFGPVLARSTTLSFSDITPYYDKEMGTSLEKFLVSFQLLQPLENIYQSKLISIQIEKSFCTLEKRRFNLDPGYLTLGKTHMLTTKDFSHRVYIQRGIFGEVNTIFSKKNQQYEPWEKTYKDFQSPLFLNFLTQNRSYYKNLLHLKKSPGP